MKKIIIFAVVFILSLVYEDVFGQTLEMKYTEPSRFPYMTTGFRLKDAAGNEIRNSDILKPIKKTDVIVEEMEGGKKVRRNVLADIDCPEQTLTTFSAVLIVDISESMNDPLPGGAKKIDVAKDVLKEWAKSFDPKRTETAITAFCGDAVASLDNPDEPIRTFTSDKDSLLLAINKMPTNCNGTNYNAAFLYKRFDTFIKQYSGLYWCRPDKAKYKPVIIFLTDGNHLSEYGGPINGGRFNIDEVQMLANQRNVTIYVIQFGTETITPENLGHLQTLSYIGKASNDNTPNIWMGVNSAQDLKNIYQDILVEAGTLGDPPPCYVAWEGGCESGSATFTFPNHGNLVGVSNFTVSPGRLPKLVVTPQNVTFNNVAPVPANNSATMTLTLKAERNYVVINGIDYLIDNGLSSDFSVVDWGPKGPPPITIDKDSSYKIVVRYRPSDSTCSSGLIEFTGFACEGKQFNVKAEMTPFVENINMGNVGIGKSLDSTFSAVFCNKTCQPIQVTGQPRITGTDASNFIVLEPTSPTTLNPGDCLQMKFKFIPTEPAGTKSAKIEIQTNYNTNQKFTGNITGNGIGGKTVTHNFVNVDSASCLNPTVIDTIMLENSGVETINITGHSFLPNSDNFSLKSGFTFPTSLASGAIVPVYIEFHPTNPPKQNANYTGTLRVISNADNPTYDIPLVGPTRNIDFNIASTLDFGEVCVGSPKTMQLTLKNTGNVPLNVTANATAPYQPGNTTYTVNPGGNQTVDVTCNPSSDGPFNANLTITNAECSLTKTVALTAMGVAPKISLNQALTFTATIGNTDPKDFILTNESNSPLRLTSITPCDNLRFTVSNINPQLPTTIPAKGTISFKVTYNPQSGDSGKIDTCLQISGTTCNFDSSAKMQGLPGSATVYVEIDEYTGYDGDPIDIPIYLRNGVNFDKSNTTKVSAQIRYDGSLLEAKPGFNVTNDVGTFKIINLTDKTVQPINTQQVLETLKFTIRKTGTVESTPLEILNVTGNGGAGFFTNDGLFTLSQARAEVIIDSVAALAGNDVKIKVRFNGSALPGDNNDKITMKVSFNGTMLEPINKAPILKSKSFDKGKWTVTYELPIKPQSGDVLGELLFHTMIGTSDTTTLFIEELTARGGTLTPVHGKFTALGLCKDGENDQTRYFYANPGPAILSMNPNPTDGMINITYQTYERGYTKMWVSDMLGNHVYDLYNGIHEPGQADVNLNGTNLGNGVYFIILQTPTQIVREKIYIMR
jgi:hypothetical protein